jgi:hypothetical protein
MEKVELKNRSNEFCFHLFILYGLFHHYNLFFDAALIKLWRINLCENYWRRKMIKKLPACEKIIKLSKKWYEQKRFHLQPKRYNKIQSANESQLPEEGPLFETRILLYRLSSELSDCRLLILLPEPNPII